MNSFHIVSKQSKVVDVVVCPSCCCRLDLKAEGKKVGAEKLPVTTWDSWLHLCMMHLFIIVPRLSGTQLNIRSPLFPRRPRTYLCNKSVASAERMKPSLTRQRRSGIRGAERAQRVLSRRAEQSLSERKTLIAPPLPPPPLPLLPPQPASKSPPSKKIPRMPSQPKLDDMELQAETPAVKSVLL